MPGLGRERREPRTEPMPVLVAPAARTGTRQKPRREPRAPGTLCLVAPARRGRTAVMVPMMVPWLAACWGPVRLLERRPPGADRRKGCWWGLLGSSRRGGRSAGALRRRLHLRRCSPMACLILPLRRRPCRRRRRHRRPWKACRSPPADEKHDEIARAALMSWTDASKNIEDAK